MLLAFVLLCALLTASRWAAAEPTRQAAVASPTPATPQAGPAPADSTLATGTPRRVVLPDHSGLRLGFV